MHVLRSTDENSDQLEVAGGIQTHTRSKIDRETAYVSIRPVVPPSDMKKVAEVENWLKHSSLMVKGVSGLNPDSSQPTHLYSKSESLATRWVGWRKGKQGIMLTR